MPKVTTKDGVEIFYKDWGPKDAQPIVFHHGWPLSSRRLGRADAVLPAKGYRVVAHDRRGHGRSTQTGDGHDMDTYAADAAAVAEHLDLRERRPCRPFDRRRRGGRATSRSHGKGRVAKAGADRRGAAADAEDRGQSGRPADRGLRRLPRRRSPPTARSSSSMSPSGPVLRLQPPGREGVSRASSRIGGARA